MSDKRLEMAHRRPDAVRSLFYDTWMNVSMDHYCRQEIATHVEKLESLLVQAEERARRYEKELNYAVEGMEKMVNDLSSCLESRSIPTHGEVSSARQYLADAREALFFTPAREKCPRCGSQDFAVARDMVGTRHCKCGATWVPADSEKGEK